MQLNESCLFCKIIQGTIPADIVMQNEHVVAFRDITPQAPVHILIVPTVHVENAFELAQFSPEITTELVKAAGQIAQKEGLVGYRSVFNTGSSAGQSIFHAHLHLLGGRPFSWPPG